MLLVSENIDLYRYEIHSLVKAFYPEEEVRVLVDEDANSQRRRKTAEENADTKELLRIVFAQNAMTLHFAAGAAGTAPADAALREENEHAPGQGEQEGRREAVYEMPAPEGTSCLEKSSSVKAVLKTFLYDSLCDYTGKTLPWGDLIGIRPTKIAMTRMEEGASKEEAIQYLERDHRVAPGKAELAADIAIREKRILGSLHYENGYSLYIGIPFCPTTCLYCSFPSFAIASWKDRVDEYLDALEREMEQTAELMQGKVLDTVYIGGGTPTSLEAEQLDRLCRGIARYFDLSTVQEFTVEAGRPDSITRAKLEALRSHPVTRISVNPQTMNEETLRIIGRRHSVQQVADIYREARDCGFDNINMDIILGLPGEDAEAVQRTAAAIQALNPDSLTVHSLAIKRASRLRRVIDEKGYPVLLNTDETMEIARKAAEAMDMKPYYLYRQKNMSGNFENVGYAREGKYGIYNILIMEEKQTIMALGAGSVTKRVYPGGRIERCDNAKEVSVYLENLEKMLGRKRKLFSEDAACQFQS